MPVFEAKKYRREYRRKYLRAQLHYFKGDFNLAIECCKRTLELIGQFEQVSSYEQFFEGYIYHIMGNIYSEKGELNLAVEYYKKSLDLTIEDKDTTQKRLRVENFGGLGFSYYLKGDLETSLKYFKQSLKIIEDKDLLVNPWGGIGQIFDGIIRVYIAKGDLENAQHYLQRLNHHIEEHPIHQNISLYHLIRAKLLKLSTRSRDRTEAEKILKELIEKEKIAFLINSALREICDLYLRELRLTNDLTIIDEINPFITQLLKNAKYQNSNLLLARTRLLQGKIALIQMNMGDTRRFFTEAQSIADKYGYDWLAKTISVEHDNLLGQLDIWEELKKSKAPVSERIKLASLDGIIDLLVEKRIIEPPKIIDEQPVLLLILSEGGILMFSYPFSDEWKRDDEIFGSFLNAFMSFSTEFFSEGLDRVKFGQYTVLMENLANFSICYLYKGQTYLAKQKLAYFTQRLQNNSSILQTLNKFHEASQVIELNDFPFLEIFITEIFNKNKI
ncbi:MAG: tetratricopeptide repeat protein [Promethearchaeota archaeon]|jgi:tetratricopeptide (TPR) repeat protein